MRNNRNLFLDDKREPRDAFNENLYGNPVHLFIDEEWEVVKNYKEFVEWILEFGVPDIISFDHDLAESHYTPKEYWNDYEKSKQWQDKQVHIEPTGAECALWLRKHCDDNNLELPYIIVHSANPVGRDKIIKFLQK
jgi:hypothetical protein